MNDIEYGLSILLLVVGVAVSLVFMFLILRHYANKDKKKSEDDINFTLKMLVIVLVVAVVCAVVGGVLCYKYEKDRDEFCIGQGYERHQDVEESDKAVFRCCKEIPDNSGLGTTTECSGKISSELMEEMKNLGEWGK